MFTNQQLMIIAGVATVTGLILYEKGKRELNAGISAITPTNPENIFYTGVNSLGSTITGQQDFNLGVWLYDITH